MKKFSLFSLPALAFALMLGGCGDDSPKRHMEKLDRGVVAVNNGEGAVFVSWRLFGTDSPDVGFDLYRSSNGAQAVRLNDAPLRGGTNFTDLSADLSVDNSYYVTIASARGRREDPGVPYTLPAGSGADNYLSIPLRTVEGYSPNDGSVGDLDGDGRYEIVVHLVGTGYDNAFAGATTEPIFQAYKLDGTFLWEINLGRNIREGAHYTQFMVYDLNGDGRAEFVCKTADGTRDGKGVVIGDPNAVWVEGPEAVAPSRDRLGAVSTPQGPMASLEGRILSGPEYLTVFSGLTGEALSTTDYLPARGNIEEWGDAYGNRSERYLAGIACLDGVMPSVIMSRGYYGKAGISAWDFVDGKLQLRWLIDSTDPGRELLRGQGNHHLSIADVDSDGRDEIVFGACVVDDDGSILNSTGLGHGNAMHVTDIDPERPGLEVWQGHESRPVEYGVDLHDALTGEVIWGRPVPAGGNRLMAADIDPRYPGIEVWTDQLYSSKGEVISQKQPSSINFKIWWDGDRLAELFDVNHISKWNWVDSTTQRIFTAEGSLSNNGSKNTPVLIADILGDWREELILRSEDNSRIRIYTTDIPTDVRLYTLMHDPHYRLSIAWQNVAYNQPPHTGFFLGEGMNPPPVPNITTAPQGAR
jgi:rhamnogalacturonan endolyase